MKLIAILFLLPSSLMAATPFTVRSETLKTFVETKNERVAGKSKEKEAAEYREGYFFRSFLPKIEVFGSKESFRKGNHPRKEQKAYGIEASMNLFNSGKDYLEESKRSTATIRKEYEKQAVLSEELSRAREVYWQILYSRELLTLLEESLKLNDSNLKNATKRINSGVATEADRVEFEMKDIDLKREHALTVIEQKNQKKYLSVLLGLEPGVEINFPEPLSHEHKWEESLLHSHDEHYFLTKPKELQSDEHLSEAKILARSFWPKLDAFVAVDQFTEREKEFANVRDRRESVLGVRLSMSLFDGFNAQREASALRSEAQAVLAESNYLRREIEVHIDNEMSSLKLLHEQLHEAEENTKRASRYYTLTASEYARGVKNSPDVLGASEKLYEMRQKHLAIIRDFQVAKSHVLSKMGK